MKQHTSKFIDVLSNSCIPSILARVHSALTTPSLRAFALATVMAAIVLFAASQMASAGVTPGPVGPLASPIDTPVKVYLHCTDGWNNSCQATSSTTAGVRLWSYFYIDGRYRGSGNATYTNVCSRFRLYDGHHTATLYAVDARRNSARIGPYRIIDCDRTAPTVATGLRIYRSTVRISPYAYDRWSGIATRQVLLDNAEVEWKVYTNVCQTPGLAKGSHSVKVVATDNAGNTRSTTRTFRCP